MQQIEEEIRRLTPSIWDTVLCLPLEAGHDFPPCGSRMVTACVYISGAWNGAVALTCDIDFASAAAGIMFSLGDGAPTTADMQDALGELANMIGGNIKALLADPSHLSLPAVVEGTDFNFRIPRSRLVTFVPFHSGEHSLSVSLLEREEKPLELAQMH